MKRILIVEDNADLAFGLRNSLEIASYEVIVANDGPSGLREARTVSPDLIILDLMLPGMDGYRVLRAVREGGSQVPVLILTARGEVQDRVRGLDLGADDYLAKPFDLPELEARVRALLRRGNAAATPFLHHGKLRLDTVGRRVFHDDQPIDLSARELAVLELLLLREGRVVTKQQIVDHLYGWDDTSSSNAVEVFVYRLRKKLEESGVEIRTVRGMGYIIEKRNAA